MADNSKIEWTDATWSPIRARCWEPQNDGSGKERIGWHCERVSEGCRNCYAERINLRLGTGYEYKPGNLRGEPGYSGGGIERPEIFLDEKMLLAPLRWKKPRMIFVCSMTDLFADFVPDEYIDKIFAVMALAPQHTFQVLTKRAERMRHYFNGPWIDRDPVAARIADATWHVAPLGHQLPEPPVICEVPVGPRLPNGEPEFGFRRMFDPRKWPLPNVWLGVSAERQQEADERIPHLLQTPAVVRFLSAEPLLGSIDLLRVAGGGVFKMATNFIGAATNTGWHNVGLHWVIVGGESGPDARPMHPDWARSLRDQCSAADVPFFFKQWGAHCPQLEDSPANAGKRFHMPPFPNAPGRVSEQQIMVRFGKKAAGRLLDGKEHNGFPNQRGQS